MILAFCVSFIKSYTQVHRGQQCLCQTNRLGSTDLSLVSF